MRCILAVDVGGTKSEAIAVRDDGTIVGWGRCGFTDPGSGTDTRAGSGRSVESIRTAVSQALESVSFSELHVVGYGKVFSRLSLGDFGAAIVHHFVHEYDGLLEYRGAEIRRTCFRGHGNVRARHYL